MPRDLGMWTQRRTRKTSVVGPQLPDLIVGPQ